MRPLAIARGALLAAVAAIATLAPAAAAQAPAAPAERFAVGSPAMQAAQAIARAHWGTDPCGGTVDIAWGRLGRHVNGISSWTLYREPGGAETIADCRIDFNTHMDFGWAKFCTVLVHEYGHLVGHDHDAGPGRLMSAVYSTPLPACTGRSSRFARRAAMRRTHRR